MQKVLSQEKKLRPTKN